MDQIPYFPLAWPFFAIPVGVFLLVVVLIQINVLRDAYTRLGISSGAALLLPRLVTRQLHQYCMGIPGVRSGVRAGSGLLRRALRGTGGRRMAPHGHRDQCRRRDDTDAALAMPAPALLIAGAFFVFLFSAVESQ